MVFSNISLIVGVVLDKVTVMKLLGLRDDEGDLIPFQVLNERLGITLYPFPCCSKSGGDKFIIGIPVKTWVRKISRCQECRDGSHCDSCIGETCQGKYPVERILDYPTKCPIKNVCMYCWRDNRAPITDVCIDCGHKPNWNMRFNHYQANRFTEQGVVKKVNRFLKKYNITRTPKIYYMLDDCLSCS